MAKARSRLNRRSRVSDGDFLYLVREMWGAIWSGHGHAYGGTLVRVVAVAEEGTRAQVFWVECDGFLAKLTPSNLKNFERNRQVAEDLEEADG